MTLLEHLVKVWRAKTARREMRYRLLYVITRPPMSRRCQPFAAIWVRAAGWA